MKNKKLITSILLGTMLLAGCSNDSNRTIRETSANNKSNDTASVEMYNGATSDYYEDYVEYEMDAPRDVQSTSISHDNTNPVQDNSINRMLIRRVSIEAETESFDEVDNLIRSKVAEFGGYFDNSSVNGTGKNYDYRVGTYIIRVPEANLDDMIEALSGNCSITARSENTEDVTLQYIDTQSQIDSLRAEQEALLNMLSDAEELDNIIILQNELTSVRYQIESLESQLRALSNQVNYSTLTLTIEEVVEEMPEVETRTETYGDKVSKSWTESLKSIKDFFANLFLGIVSISPILISILVITVIVIIVVKLKLRKRRKLMAANESTQPVAQNEDTTEENTQK